MTAARPKAALFSAEKLAPPPGQGKIGAEDAAQDATATLVAPPRTVSDITAILDQQKPDAAAIARLTATADAVVPAGLKGGELADFHYKRAQARALLGRADALDDAELAVSNSQGVDYKNLGSRYEDLLTRLLRDEGQFKRASALLAKQSATFANQSKGKLFHVNYVFEWSYLKSGDIDAAESYARSQSGAALRGPALAGVSDLRDGLASHGGGRQRADRGAARSLPAGRGRLSQGVDPIYKFIEDPPAVGKQTRRRGFGKAG